MRAVELIRIKRDGGALDGPAIDAFVDGVTSGSWPDYQVAALLMAIVLRGMTIDEASRLTGAMAASGRRLNHAAFDRIAVDKHSTGGVGDKVSLIAAPLAAAAGALVPMMSGRGLGHTGGTLDKLEAIPGFRTWLAPAEVYEALSRTGCALFGQTEDVAPADRRLYGLRDVTATVESLPLIAASILSKKLASGVGALVLDVKVGRGAFMPTETRARELAEWLVRIAGEHGLRAEAWLTRMDAPLGRAVGNASEVVEAIETLKGRGPADLVELSRHLAARMLVLGGVVPDDAAARVRVARALESGAGLETFRAIVAGQDGDAAVVDDYGRLPQPACREDWLAPEAGVVVGLDAGRIGLAAAALGAGRDRADAAIDPAAGIEVVAPIGTPVARGEPVLRLAGRTQARLDAARVRLAGAVTLGDHAPASGPLVLDHVDGRAVAR